MEKLVDIIENLPSRKSVKQNSRKSVRQTNSGLLDRPIESLLDRPTLTLLNTDLNTNKHIGVCGLCLSEKQACYVMKKTGASWSELQKALKILSESRPKNVMKTLLTAAFYDGECILASNEKDEEDERSQRLHEKCIESGRKCIQEREKAKTSMEIQGQKKKDALKWFQELPPDHREQVRQKIAARFSYLPIRHRVMCGDFSPSILAVLVLVRNEEKVMPCAK